jgi:hypothetical protein
MKKGIASFDADIILLRDLLKESHVIPDMQRNYEWQTNTGDLHVDKLWNSFWDFHLEDLKQEDVYYTGTMISFPEGKKSSIIDGQQRLTTISLMFFAMRDLVEESTIKSNSIIKFSGEEYEISKLSKIISKITIGTPDKPRLSPKKDHVNTVAFNWLLHSPGKRPLATLGVGNPNARFKVNKAYRFFKKKFMEEFYGLEEIKDFQEMMNFADHILDGVVFNLTTVRDMAQGYRIFSSENTTGLALNHVDITRALIMAQIDRKKLYDAEQKVTQNLKRMSNSLKNVSRSEKNNFIKIFFGIQVGKPLTKSKLMNKLSDEVKKKKNDTQINFLASKLSKWCKVYCSQILESTPDLPHYRIHSDLRKCRFKQHQPLLLSLLTRKSKPTKEEMNEILSIVEIIYVMNNLILNQRASVVESTFWRWASRAADEDISIDKLKKLMLKDIRSLPLEIDREEFLQKFSGLHPNKDQATFLLSKIERFKQPKLNDIEDFEGIISLPIFPIINNFTNLPEDWQKITNSESYHNERLQNRIGNYILTRKKSSIETYRINRMRYTEKMPLLRQRTKNFKFTTERFSGENFGFAFFPQDIINLSDELAEIAFELWNFDNLD